MKKVLLACIMVILVPNLVLADENFDEAIRLIQSNIPCSSLTDNQLEMIGDYFMEQMHPGELHEIMDERMGGEGSESLRAIHINMAKSFYCGDTNAMPMGMMSMMMNRAGGGMMGYYPSFGYGYGLFGWVFMVAFWIAIIWLIVWAIRQATSGRESSIEVLNKRLAKGEIGKKEYEELKKTLKRR